MVWSLEFSATSWPHEYWVVRVMNGVLDRRDRDRHSRVPPVRPPDQMELLQGDLFVIQAIVVEVPLLCSLAGS